MLWCASLLSARTGKDDDEDADSSSADEPGEQATPKKGASDKESGSGSPPGQQMEGLRRDMDALSKDMASTLTEFRSSPSDAQTFASEMLLVQKRGEWLAAVAEQDESSLNLKISAQVTPSTAGDAQGLSAAWGILSQIQSPKAGMRRLFLEPDHAPDLKV